MGDTLAVEPGAEATVGHCDACGHESRLFRGFVYEDESTYAVYACCYTASHPEHGVSMAVSLHGWGEGADPSVKECVALEWRNTETGPACRMVDASETAWAKEQILGRMLSREQALASGRATEAFAVADAVWRHDQRLPDALEKTRVREQF
jgi:hypothetical protein